MEFYKLTSPLSITFTKAINNWYEIFVQILKEKPCRNTLESNLGQHCDLQVVFWRMRKTKAIFTDSTEQLE